ncbi:MAG TPA: hypothetical protein VES01_03090 [Dermatophilaceae bacterium]|nr:hypothetical protein [Dermatophilaceae bacterium]
MAARAIPNATTVAQSRRLRPRSLGRPIASSTNTASPSRNHTDPRIPTRGISVTASAPPN